MRRFLAPLYTTALPNALSISASDLQPFISDHKSYSNLYLHVVLIWWWKNNTSLEQALTKTNTMVISIVTCTDYTHENITEYLNYSTICQAKVILYVYDTLQKVRNAWKSVFFAETFQSFFAETFLADMTEFFSVISKTFLSMT